MTARTSNMAEHALGGVVRRVATRLTAQRYHDQTDRQLLESFLHEQDESAFAALVRRHQRRVHAALTRVLSDPADVDDAFQATFLVLVRKAASVRWQEGLGTWLYAVAHRVAVHARDRTLARLRHEEQAASRSETTVAPPDLSCREACAAVHEQLDRLPEKLRLPLLLCYLEGKSRDEAAAQLGVSTHTVKGRLERGRNLLRQRLLRRGVPLTAALLAALTHSPARASAPDLVQITLAAITGPSARVAALANAVSATMILSKFKFVLGLLLLVGVLAALGARLPAPAAPAADPDKKPARADSKEQHDPVLAGRVLDSAGKPIAGARLSLWLGKGKPRPLGETAADGSFRIRLDVADMAGKPKLIVQAKGQGPDWIEVGRRVGAITFRLNADVPIQGRILDLEGRPIVGATVSVRSAGKSGQGDLTAYVDAWKDVMSGNVIPSLLEVPPAALEAIASTTTGKDGRFRIEGLGRERAVELTVRGSGIEHQWFSVITRPGFTSKSRRFRGPSFDLLVGPGKELVGVVRDKATGKPVAGAEVTCQIGRVRTDAQGRYRIDGLRKQDSYGVWAWGKDYFNTLADAKDTPGRESVRLDLEINRGVRVTGRLLDRASGKPISGVVGYYIKSDNPHLKNYAFSPGTGLGNGPAGADGTFSILTIPGPGYLTVQADRNLYRRATLESWNGQPFMATPNALFPYYYHAMVSIDPDEKKPASLKVDIHLDRGQSLSGSVVGPDGKPVSGAIAFGLTAIPDPGSRSYPRPARFGPPPPARLDGAAFTAVGLNPKEPRHLVFLHPEKKLGKIVKVRGDEKEPLVVKLEPTGAITARVLTEDGKPAEGRFVTPWPPTRFAFYRDYPIELLHNIYSQRRTGRLIRWLPERGRTDAEGKFRMEGLLPGLTYEVRVSPDETMRALPSHFRGGIMVEAGKTKELGELRRGWR
jgi:RNA polymerase sigma factor (sigma-70 family)